MWKPSVKVLFSLMILMVILGGISLNFVDWNILQEGRFIEIYNEVDIPIIFFLLSISFLLTYLKRSKEKSN